MDAPLQLSNYKGGMCDRISDVGIIVAYHHNILKIMDCGIPYTGTTNPRQHSPSNAISCATLMDKVILLA